MKATVNITPIASANELSNIFRPISDPDPAVAVLVAVVVPVAEMMTTVAEAPEVIELMECAGIVGDPVASNSDEAVEDMMPAVEVPTKIFEVKFAGAVTVVVVAAEAVDVL